VPDADKKSDYKKPKLLEKATAVYTGIILRKSSVDSSK
jgi:hypothetical protein